MADEELGILIEAKSEGQHAINAMKDAFDDLRRSIIETQVAMDAAVPAMAAATVATDAMSPAIRDASNATGDWSGELLRAVPLVGQWLAGLADIPVLGPVVVGILLSMAAAIGYVTTALVLSTAAILTLVATAAAGFTAIAVAAGLAMGGIGALGVAVVLLSEHYAKVHALEDPLKKLEDHIGTVADAWGEQAAPMAKQIIELLDRMLPAIQSAGQQMLFWFGQQLPHILPIVSDMTHALSAAFNELWPVVAGFLNEAIRRAPEFEGFWRAAIHGAIDVLKGFLENLLRFVDWFKAEWPKLEPIVRQVMDQAGRAIQALGREAERLVNWFIANWPQIQQLMENLEPVLIKVGQGVEFIAWALAQIALSYNAAVFGLGQVRNAVLDLDGKVQDLAANLAALFAHIPGMGHLATEIARVGTSAATNVSGEASTTGPRFQSGGVVPGPFGAPRLAIVHGGEQIIPAAQAYMGSGGGGGDIHYHIDVHVPTAVNLADVGRETVRAIQEYERRGGKAWRS